MRAFRFRAWHKQEKKMYQVSTIHFDVQHGMGSSDRSNLVELCDKSKAYRDDQDVELMQYTGLVDRHGKTICEGDILRWFFDGEQILYVEWEYNYFKLVEVRNKDANVMVADKRSLEIIGNIYETPELLTQEHKV